MAKSVAQSMANDRSSQFIYGCALNNFISFLFQKKRRVKACARFARLRTLRTAECSELSGPSNERIHFWALMSQLKANEKSRSPELFGLNIRLDSFKRGPEERLQETSTDFQWMASQWLVTSLFLHLFSLVFCVQQTFEHIQLSRSVWPFANIQQLNRVINVSF